MEIEMEKGEPIAGLLEDKLQAVAVSQSVRPSGSESIRSQ